MGPQGIPRLGHTACRAPMHTSRYDVIKVVFGVSTTLCMEKGRLWGRQKLG